MAFVKRLFHQLTPISLTFFIQIFWRTDMNLIGQVSRITLTHNALYSGIKTDGWWKHHQHHSAQYTDGSQTGAISLHTITHWGNRYKVLFPIIKTFIFLQNPAKGYWSGNKKQIRCYDNKNNRSKKPCQSHNRVFDCYRQTISNGKHHNTNQRQ